MLRTLHVAVVTLSLLATAATARAQVNRLPTQLDGIGIDEKPGATLPVDLSFLDQDGRSVRFADYFDGQRPVALVLAYYQCPMLCSMVLNGLTDGLHSLARDSGYTAGDRFRVVTVSFDPRDTTKLAHDKRANQLAAYGQTVPDKGWDFLTSDPKSVGRLADAIGFHYRWDEKQQQFAHAAGVFFFTPKGVLSRTLYGVQFSQKNLRLALAEAAEGKLGGTWDKVLLFCFHYDPAVGGYTLVARRVMEAGGIVTVISLALFVAILFRKKGPALAVPTERSV